MLALPSAPARGEVTSGTKAWGEGGPSCWARSRRPEPGTGGGREARAARAGHGGPDRAMPSRSAPLPPRRRARRKPPETVRLRPVKSERWQPGVLDVAGIVALNENTLGAGFINDDYLFLEETRRYGVWGALVHGGGLANFFRPLSREVWFGLLSPFSGGGPGVFHLAQLALFLVALGLLADLLAVFVPGPKRWFAPAVLAGIAWYALDRKSGV